MTPLQRTLEDARIVLCVGHGGVGKTTITAALATWAARHGRRTAVLTVCERTHRVWPLQR